MSDRRQFLGNLGRLGALVSAAVAMPTRLYAEEVGPAIQRTDRDDGWRRFPPGSEDRDVMRVTTHVDFSRRGEGYRIGPIDLPADAVRRLGGEQEVLPTVFETSARELVERMERDGMLA